VTNGRVCPLALPVKRLESRVDGPYFLEVIFDLMARLSDPVVTMIE